jgi:hypothetical protein
MSEQPRWIDYWPLSEIRRAARNAKGHDASVIGGSITRFGYTSPIELDERTGLIVAGHGRLDDLEEREARGAAVPDGIEVDEHGHWRAPIVRGWSSVDDLEAEAYLIVANEATIAGGWVRPDLAAMLERLRESRREAFDATGYTDERLEELLASVSVPHFEPVDVTDQPTLGDRPNIVCPNCGHEWRP